MAQKVAAKKVSKIIKKVTRKLLHAKPKKPYMDAGANDISEAVRPTSMKIYPKAR